MLVVSDIDDVFLPKPTDLLVNLTESRPAIENLLGRLNDMFQENHIIGSALGPALQAAFKMMVRIAYTSGSGLSTDVALVVAHWWQDHRSLVQPAVPWCRCCEEQGGPQDPRHFKGTAYPTVCLLFKSHILNYTQESSLLQPASPFYKTFAIECSRAQVAVDMFLFSAAYQDVATLGKQPRVLLLIAPTLM